MQLEEISKIMGHKSIATTFEIYCGIIEAKGKIATLIPHLIQLMPLPTL